MHQAAVTARHPVAGTHGLNPFPITRFSISRSIASHARQSPDTLERMSTPKKSAAPEVATQGESASTTAAAATQPAPKKRSHRKKPASSAASSTRNRSRAAGQFTAGAGTAAATATVRAPYGLTGNEISTVQMLHNAFDTAMRGFGEALKKAYQLPNDWGWTDDHTAIGPMKARR